MWPFAAASLVILSLAVFAFLNGRPVAGSLGVVGAAIPPIVLGVGVALCSDHDLACGYGILVALVYSTPIVIGLGLVTAIGAFRRTAVSRPSRDSA